MGQCKGPGGPELSVFRPLWNRASRGPFLSSAGLALSRAGGSGLWRGRPLVVTGSAAASPCGEGAPSTRTEATSAVPVALPVQPVPSRLLRAAERRVCLTDTGSRYYLQLGPSVKWLGPPLASAPCTPCGSMLQEQALYTRTDAKGAHTNWLLPPCRQRKNT